MKIEITTVDKSKEENYSVMILYSRASVFFQDQSMTNQTTMGKLEGTCRFSGIL